MQKLELLYDGKKITYTRNRDGSLSILLPISMESDGKYYSNIIENDSIGWRMTSKQLGDDSISSSVWIRNNGQIAHGDSKRPEFQLLEEKIDPDKKTDNPVYKKAQELYRILEQTYKEIIAFEKAPWTPEQVANLKRKQLDMYLKLLGYDGTSEVEKRSEPDVKYASLTKVGQMLESYKSLNFVTESLNMFNLPDYTVRIPEFLSERVDSPEEIIEQYSRLVDSVDSKTQTGNQFMEEQDEYISRSRGISEDYFLDMKKKVSPEEWKKYYSVSLKTAKFIMGLNYDILPESAKKSVVDLTELTQEQIEDKISEIIDSRDFAEASDIENRFVSQEAEELSSQIETLEQSDDAFRRGQLAAALKELKDKAQETRKEKEEKRSAYNKMEKLLRAKNIVIRPDPDFKGGE